MTSRAHTRRVRSAFAAATVAGIAITASACGGEATAGGSGASIPTASPSAAAPTAGTSDAFAPGARVDTATIKRMFADATESATTVHVEMEMTGQVTMSGSGDMDMASDPVEASLHLSSSSLGGDITMLMVDDAMYLRSAMLGSKYVKVATDDESSAVGRMGLDSIDPSAMFDRLGESVTGGTYVGAETVAGTGTDHYRFTVGAGGAKGRKSQTMDVWFDDGGRYRKMAMSINGESVTETFSDWGEPVEVKAPPAGQIRDMSGLMNGQAGKTAQ